MGGETTPPSHAAQENELLAWTLGGDLRGGGTPLGSTKASPVPESHNAAASSPGPYLEYTDH